LWSCGDSGLLGEGCVEGGVPGALIGASQGQASLCGEILPLWGAYLQKRDEMKACEAIP
jgi:hypothetical protein